MDKNWIDMTAEEREATKALHKRMRSEMKQARGQEHRYMLLAWGYVRGFPFRRIERSHHMQGTYEHNMPWALSLTSALAKYLPEFEADFASKWQLKPGGRIEAWLKDPNGAIPALAPRAKKPYQRAIAAE